MSSTTQISDWLEAVRSNAALLADAVRTAGPAAPVPTCPEWTAADLLAYAKKVLLPDTVAEQERVGRSNLPEPGEGDDPVEWFEAGAAVVVTALETIDPDTPVWTWASAAPVPVRFWVRRMAHETAIHRVDAESAAGRAGPVEPAGLAVDGIDELLELLTVRIGPDDPLAGLTGSYHFHTTDVPGEWVVVFGTDGVHVAREHAKADVAIRGAASDLELFLYNRRGDTGLEVFGDPARVTAWREHIRF